MIIYGSLYGLQFMCNSHTYALHDKSRKAVLSAWQSNLFQIFENMEISAIRYTCKCMYKCSYLSLCHNKCIVICRISTAFLWLTG